MIPEVVGNASTGPHDVTAGVATDDLSVLGAGTFKRRALLCGVLCTFFFLSVATVIGVLAATGAFSGGPAADRAAEQLPNFTIVGEGGGASSADGEEADGGNGTEASSSAGSCFMGRDKNGPIILCNVDEAGCSLLGSQYWYPPGYINDRNTPGCCHCADSCDHSQEWGTQCVYYGNCQLSMCVGSR